MVTEFRQGFIKFTKKLPTLQEPDMHVPVSLENDVASQEKAMKRTHTQIPVNLTIGRQCNSVHPSLFNGKEYEKMKIVRHRTTDFDVWSIIPDKKSVWKLKGVPDNTPLVPNRPVSEISAYELERQHAKKFPILGPTRQQTEFYFKHKPKELQGLRLQGPSLDKDTLKRFNSEYKNREDKYSEIYNDGSSKKLKHSWSTITSGSIISRKQKGNGINGDTTDGLQDVRFFAELVKPLQYRLRIHEKEEKEKVLFPSKYGFHQRSHSPTFRRLLEATEKLKIIAEHETVQTLLKQNANINEKVTSCKKSEPEVLVDRKEHFRTAKVEQEVPKTPEITARSIEDQDQTTFLTNEAVLNKDCCINSDNRENVSVISGELLGEIEDEDEDEEEKHEEDNSFKVDFNVKETHAELHLFLPKINSGNKSAKTNKKGESDEGSVKTDRSDPVILPAIKVDSIHQIKSYQNPPGRKFKRQDTFKKKKKKPVERIKSAADQDKKVRDHLNDVHTLISIEDHHSSHSSESICNFENCPYHSLLRKTQETMS